MPIKNYTTSVAVEQTLNDLQKILSRAKASAIMTEFDPDGFANALSFRITCGGQLLHFRLPVNVAGVMAALNRSKTKSNEAKGRRIAWRIVKDWVDSQMALIESQQAELPQVFLPYAVAANGRTLYDSVREKGFLQLTDARQ